MSKKENLKKKVFIYILCKEVNFMQKDIASIFSVSEQLLSSWVKEISYRVKIEIMENKPESELLTILEESRIKLESMGYKKLGNDILEELKWNKS